VDRNNEYAPTIWPWGQSSLDTWFTFLGGLLRPVIQRPSPRRRPLRRATSGLRRVPPVLVGLMLMSEFIGTRRASVRPGSLQFGISALLEPSRSPRLFLFYAYFLRKIQVVGAHPISACSRVYGPQTRSHATSLVMVLALHDRPRLRCMRADGRDLDCAFAVDRNAATVHLRHVAVCIVRLWVA